MVIQVSFQALISSDERPVFGSPLVDRRVGAGPADPLEAAGDRPDP
jgi:hypothetical protein